MAVLLSPPPVWRRRGLTVLAGGLVIALVVTLAEQPHSRRPPQAQTVAASCPQARPDATAAAAAARLCGERVEAESARSEYETTWANPDGTLTTEVSVVPQRVERADGSWVAPDASLTKGPDGLWRPVASLSDVAFSDGGGGPFVTLRKEGHLLTMAWPTPLPAPRIEGDSAIYALADGMDLVVRATTTGFSHTVVVRTRTALKSDLVRALHYRVGGDVTVSAGDGGVMFSAGEQVLASAGDALAWDSSRDQTPREDLTAAQVPAEALASTAKVPGARARLAAAALSVEGADLVVSADRTLLDDPAVELPVYIDPDIAAGKQKVAYATQNNSNGVWTDNVIGPGDVGGDNMRVGKNPSNSAMIYRSFLEFPLSSTLLGQPITDAYISGTADHTYLCSNNPPQPVFFYRSAGITAANKGRQTWPGPGLIAYLGSANVVANEQGCSDSNNDFETDSFTSDMTAVLATGATTYTVAVAARDSLGSGESDQYRWMRFFVDKFRLHVTYNAPPTLGTLSTIPPTTCVTGAGRPIIGATPTFKAVVSDVDGGAVSATFEYGPVGTATPTSQTIANVPSGTEASLPIAPGTFTDGNAYQWRAKAVDPGNLSSAWSSWCEFTVDGQPPGVPFVSSTDYPENGRGTAASGQFTFTPATGNTDVVAFTYQMDTETAETTVNGTGPTTVTITPSAEGHRSLTVRAKDQAGNLSAPKVYEFDVGRAGIAQPLPGAAVTSRAKIALEVVDSTLTSVRYRYRRGPGGVEADIPLANLRFANGSTPTVPQNPLSTVGGYVIWNAADTLGSAGGVAQIMAELYPASGPAYQTAWVSITVDPDSDLAAGTQVGPGSLNLLTGDYTLSSTDVNDLGLSVSRVASSREPGDGWLPQGERLTANQRQISTDTTGFITDSGAPLARSTTLGQGSSTDSLEITASPSMNDSFAALGCQYAMCNGMQPGKRYRFSGWIYVPAATGLTGAVPDRELRLVAHYWNNGAYQTLVSAKASYTGAWQELTLDFTVPATATQAFVRLYNGMPTGSGKKVYYDNLSLRELVAPFGPSWRGGVADAGAGSEFSYLDFPVPDVALVHTATGGEISFAKTGSGGFFPEPGAEMFTLAYNSGGNYYDLTDIDGTVVRFTTTGSAAPYTAASSWTTQANSTTSYLYTTTDSRTLVSRVVSPAESGVTGCNVPVGTTPGRGCEVLEYVYATTTTATSSTFGDVKDQVSAVKLWTWDPATSAETAVDVVRYTYDQQGQLREVWDPRVTPALKTTYEYTDGRVTKATPAGELPWMFDYGTIPADTGNAGRLYRVRRSALQQGSPTTTDGEIATNVVYQVPLTRAAGGPHDMDAATVATWGQTDLPTDATAIFGPEDPVTIQQATDTAPGRDGYQYATVHYLNASAQEINTATPSAAGIAGANIDSTQYDKFGNVVWELQATNRLIALDQHPDAEDILNGLNLSTLDPAGRAQALATVHEYSADGLDLIESTGPTAEFRLERDVADPDGAGPLPGLTAGDSVIGRPHTVKVYDEGKPDGATYHLITSETSGATLQTLGYPDIDTRKTVTGYGTDNGSYSGWVLGKPTKVIADADGANLASYVIYDSGGRPTASWGIGSNGADARATQTIYYTAGANSADAACGNVPEWAGQPCVTRKAGAVTGQDPARMADNLPVRRVTSYTRWGDVHEVTEAVPDTSASRTTTTDYDSAGRVTSIAVASTGDGATAIPTITTDYSPTTGQVTATHAGTQTITREYDLLGRVYRYIDADGAVTTSEFDRYGKPSKVTDTTGYATFNYNRTSEPRGLLTSVTDSVAGTFSAEYSPDGQLTVLHYPGGITRRDHLDTNLEPDSRTYERDSDHTFIYSETLISNSAGETVSDANSAGVRDYTYDQIGRLTKVQDNIDGSGCTTRTYGYDDRTNRTWRKTWNPGSGGECRSTGEPDTESNHTVDSADRLTDAGYTYDPFGRITTMPGGLTNTFYANDLVASQTLDDSRQSWTLDPNRRFRAFSIETLVDGTWTNATSKLNHYGDDSDEPRWIVEDVATGVVTRMVSGPDGDLVATTGLTGGTAIQIVNLHGDVVSTIDTSGTPTAFRHYDEFGVPATGQSNDRYGWLGGKQRSAEALGAVILMGVRLYHPDTGRFLQPDPVDGGSATAYDYCAADPVNCFDLDGRWGFHLPSISAVVSSVKKVAAVVAPIAAVASIIPGPIGTAAALVSATCYAANGDWKNAAIMTATAAAAFIGAGVAGAATVLAVKAGAKVISKAPQIARAIAGAGKAIGGASKALASLGKYGGQTLRLGVGLTARSLKVAAKTTLKVIGRAATAVGRGAVRAAHAVAPRVVAGLNCGEAANAFVAPPGHNTLNLIKYGIGFAYGFVRNKKCT